MYIVNPTEEYQIVKSFEAILDTSKCRFRLAANIEDELLDSVQLFLCTSTKTLSHRFVCKIMTNVEISSSSSLHYTHEHACWLPKNPALREIELQLKETLYFDRRKATYYCYYTLLTYIFNVWCHLGDNLIGFFAI